MRFPFLFAALISAASPVVAQSAAIVATVPVVASRGQTISTADRARLGSVVRVNGDGSVAIIFDSRLLTIPASTLRLENGRLTTSLSRREVISLP